MQRCWRWCYGCRAALLAVVLRVPGGVLLRELVQSQAGAAIIVDSVLDRWLSLSPGSSLWSIRSFHATPPDFAVDKSAFGGTVRALMNTCSKFSRAILVEDAMP